MIVYVDHKPIIFTTTAQRCTVLEACLLLNAKIPTFCYHYLFNLEGNCRMCLVEIEGFNKPQTSCCLPIQNNMKIYTSSPFVKKARENVLEFLLLNHPLDCPICDQGGECDLQDQSFIYSSDKSRFFFKKRSVSNKYYNNFIKTIMTRCIHCTKCIRYSTEVLGTTTLGSLNRGLHTEIGSFIKQFNNSYFSGNLIDICPVGAFTSKSHKEKTPAWEIVSPSSRELVDEIFKEFASTKKSKESFVPKSKQDSKDSKEPKSKQDSKDSKEPKSKQDSKPTLQGHILPPVTEFLIDDRINEDFWNRIDSIPVGALTSKPYSLKNRPWEIISHDSLDLFDSFGSNIRIDLDSKQNSIVRVLPKPNKNLNDILINDRIRFGLDGLKINRLNSILIYETLDKFKKSSILNNNYPVSLSVIKIFKNFLQLSTTNLLFTLNSDLNTETYLLLKYYENLYNCNFNSNNYSKSFLTFSKNYFFTISIDSINTYNEFLFFNLNSQLEFSYFYLKLVHLKLKTNLKIFNFGYFFKNNNITHLGFTSKFLKFLYIKKYFFMFLFNKFHSPLFIVNSLIFNRFDGKSIYLSLIQGLSQYNYDLNTYFDKSNSSSYNILGFKSKNFLNLSIKKFNLNFDSLYNSNYFIKYSLNFKSYNISEKLKSLYVIPILTEYETGGMFINVLGFKQKILKLPNYSKTNYTLNLILKTFFKDINLVSPTKYLYTNVLNSTSKKIIFNFNLLHPYKYNFIYTTLFIVKDKNFYNINTIVQNSKNLQSVL